jgi:hypothetical protein
LSVPVVIGVLVGQSKFKPVVIDVIDLVSEFMVLVFEFFVFIPELLNVSPKVLDLHFELSVLLLCVTDETTLLFQDAILERKRLQLVG